MQAATLFKRLGQRALDLLSDADTARKPSALTHAYAAPETAVPSTTTTPDIDKILHGQLRDILLAQRGQPGAGVVNFVSLAKLRERIGAGWEQVANKADEIARQAIQRRVTPIDVFTRVSPLNYLVLFSHLTKAQAQLKCALIAEEIAQRLLGAEVTDDMIEVKTAQIGADGKMTLETAPRVADLAASLFSAAATEGVDEETDAVSAADGADFEFEDAADDPFSRVRLVYRPVWDVSKNTLATYVCLPAIDAPDGEVLAGEAVVQGVDKPDIAFDLDMMVLRRVVEDLLTMARTGRKVLIIAPVHFETLATRSRRRIYLQTCQAIPPNMRSLTIFEMAGTPPTVPPSRLMELAVQLRRFSRAIILRAPIGQSLFSPPTATGVFAVGADVSADKRKESELITDMTRFASAASRVGLRTFLHGINSVSLTTSAVGAGFEYIAGEITASIVERPTAAYKFEPRNVYDNPFTRRDAPPGPQGA